MIGYVVIVGDKTNEESRANALLKESGALFREPWRVVSMVQVDKRKKLSLDV